MRKTIKFFWIGATLAIWLSSLGTSVLKADDTDLDLKIRSLTNRARAYHLRVEAMEGLVSDNPEKAFPLLVTLLKDSKEVPSLRYLAAQNLSRIDHSKAAETFNKLLNDRRQDSFTRRTALAEWAQLAPVNLNQRVDECLDDLSEDTGVRQYCLVLLSQSKKIGKLEKIRTLVHSKQETLSIRMNALFELERLEDLDFVLGVVRQFLADQGVPEELRRNCVLLALRLKDAPSIALLEKIAHNPQEPERLRKTAETGLSSLHPSKELASVTRTS